MKTKRIKIKIILVLLLFLSGNSFTQVLTLKESIELGLKNSKELKIAQSKVNSADAHVTEIGSQILPQLKFDASYTRLSDITPFQITVPFYLTPVVISQPVLNNYQFKLSLQQPLFTGFRLSSLKSAARYNYEATNYEYESSINEYAYKIQEAFFNLYNAQKINELVNEQLLSINQNVEDTKNFLDNGLVSINDLLKLEVQQSNIELKLIEAKNNLDIAQMNFNRVIGVKLNSNTEITLDDLNAGLSSYSPDEIITEAKSNRNELKALEQKVAMTDEGITSSKSTWFPNIYLFSDFYYAHPNQRIQPSKEQFDDTWDVGVALNWSLWDWGNTSSKSAQAEELKIQTETSLSQLQEAVEIEVYQAYLNYLKSDEKITVSKKAVDQAQENYRITKEKYDVQLATSSELVDAHVYLLQAKTTLTNSLVEFQLAKAKLDKAIGRKIY